MPVGNHLPHGETAQGGPLKRELGERHIRLMALGACIGVGLFLGSAKAIEMAGPAIMLSYIIGGLAILVIMRALGEMAVHNPVAGSFSRYAQDYLGPLAGFLTGWNYWFLWLVTCVAEITAVAVYMGVWFPDVPRWIWALAALISMGSINLIAVKAFGEFEFWFALIKIVTIIAMVVGGIGVIAFGFGNDGVALGISNLWAHGGFMPNGHAVVAKTEGDDADATQHHGDDGDDLDQGEPELELTKGLDRDQVDRAHAAQGCQGPDPARHVGEPNAHVHRLSLIHI